MCYGFRVKAIHNNWDQLLFSILLFFYVLIFLRCVSVCVHGKNTRPSNSMILTLRYHSRSMTNRIVVVVFFGRPMCLYRVFYLIVYAFVCRWFICFASPISLCVCVRMHVYISANDDDSCWLASSCSFSTILNTLLTHNASSYNMNRKNKGIKCPFSLINQSYRIQSNGIYYCASLNGKMKEIE